MKSGFLIVIIVSFFCLKGIAQRPAHTIPSFNFLRLDNTAFTDKQLAKDQLLFFVFFDAGCEHCHHAIQYIDQHYQAFKKAAIYFVSLDKVTTINEVMNKYGKGLTGKKNVIILQDTKNEFIQKFGPSKYPSLFLYSPGKKLILYDDNEQNLLKFTEKIKASAK